MGGGSQVDLQTEEGFYALFRVGLHIIYYLEMLTIRVHIQPGVPRNLQDTIRAIEEQVQVTLDGETVSRLTKEQRRTGVKDPVAQLLLDKLHARRKQIVKSSADGARTSKAQIAVMLQAELGQEAMIQQINPLLRMKGQYLCITVCISLTKHVIVDFDVHKDTPLEILHTVLLGALK
jgi:hypothetical protein